jgi:hypothetical protein
MIEERVPVAIAIGAALLPALAFGGISAGRSALWFTAADADKPAEKGKKGHAAHSVLEQAPVRGNGIALASPAEEARRGIRRGFAAGDL